MGCASQIIVQKQIETEIQDSLTYIGTIYNQNSNVQQSIFQLNTNHTFQYFSYITINIQSTSYVTQILQQQYINDIYCLKLLLSGPQIPENFKRQTFDYQISRYQESLIKFNYNKGYIFIVTGHTSITFHNFITQNNNIDLQKSKILALLRGNEQMLYDNFPNVQKAFSEQQCLQLLNIWLRQDYEAVVCFGPMWLQQSIQLLLLYYQKRGIGLYELLCCAKRLVMQSDISLYNSWISLQPVEQTFQQQVDKTYLLHAQDLLPMELEYQQSKLHKNVLYELKNAIYVAFNQDKMQKFGQNDKQLKISDQQIVNLLQQHQIITNKNPNKLGNTLLHTGLIRPFSNHTNPISSKLDTLQTRSFSPHSIESRFNLKTDINSQALEEYPDQQVIDKQRIFSAQNDKTSTITRSKSVTGRPSARTSRSTSEYRNYSNIKQSKSSTSITQQSQYDSNKHQHEISNKQQVQELYQAKSVENISKYAEQEPSEINRTVDSASETLTQFKLKASSRTMPVNELMKNINTDKSKAFNSPKSQYASSTRFKKNQSIGTYINLTKKYSVYDNDQLNLHTRAVISQNSYVSPNNVKLESLGSPRGKSPIKQCSFVSEQDQHEKSIHNMGQISGVMNSYTNQPNPAGIGFKVQTLSDGSDISSIEHVSSDHARQISF